MSAGRYERLMATGKVGLKPGVDSVSKSKAGVKTAEEDRVVSGVEGSAEV